MKAGIRIVLTLIACLCIHKLGSAVEQSPAPCSQVQCDLYLATSIIAEFEAETFEGKLAGTAFTNDKRDELKKEAVRLYREGNFLESLVSVEELLSALSEENSADNAQRMVCARILKGQLHLVQGNYRAAIDELALSRDELSTLPPKLAVIRLALQGEALNQLGDRRGAFIRIDEARELLGDGLQPRDASLAHDVVLQLAQVAAPFGHVKDSHLWWCKLSEVPVTKGSNSPVFIETDEQNVVRQVRLDRVRANILRQIGLQEEAATEFAKAIEARKGLQLKNDRELVQLHIEAADSKVRISTPESYDEAEHLLNNAEALLGQLNLEHDFESADILSLQGQICIRRKQFAEGETLLVKSSSMRQKLNPTHPGIAINELERLAIPSATDNVTRAQEMALAAADLSDHDRVNAARYSLVCARLFAAQHHNSAAEEMYTYTIRLSSPLCGPANSGVAAATDGITRLYANDGKTELAIQLLDSYLESLQGTECIEGADHRDELLTYFESRREVLRGQLQAK